MRVRFLNAVQKKKSSMQPTLNPHTRSRRVRHPAAHPPASPGSLRVLHPPPCRGGKSPPSEEGGYIVPVTARRLLFQNHLDVRVVNLGPGLKGWMKRSAVTWKKAARFLAWVLPMARLAWKTSEVMPFVAKSFRGCFWVRLRASWTAPCCGGKGPPSTSSKGKGPPCERHKPAL